MAVVKIPAFVIFTFRVLKDKFQNVRSQQQSSTSSQVAFPELLQGILDYNPTVFDTTTSSHGKLCKNKTITKIDY